MTLLAKRTALIDCPADFEHSVERVLDKTKDAQLRLDTAGYVCSVVNKALKEGPATPVLFLLGFMPAFHDGEQAVLVVSGCRGRSWSHVALMLDALEADTERYARGFNPKQHGAWSYDKCIDHLTQLGWMLTRIPSNCVREVNI